MTVGIIDGISLGSGKILKTIGVSTASTVTVIAAVPNRIIRVYAVKLIAASPLSVNFRDGAVNNLEGAQSIAANGGYIEQVTPPDFLFQTAVGNSLDLVVAGGGTIAGRISYWDGDDA